MEKYADKKYYEFDDILEKQYKNTNFKNILFHDCKH